MLCFAGFELDTEHARLRGPNGEAIRLRPKSFDMLQLLVSNSGSVLSKQDLTKAIWPNIHVGRDSLFQCIREIRNALGDDQRQLIKLVSGRGYLFDAHVSARPGGGSARPGVGAKTPAARVNYEWLLGSIDQLYAAALDPGRWQDFLTSLAAQFEAQNAFVCEVEYRKRSLAYVGLPQPARAHVPVQRYENLIDEDPRSHAFRSSGIKPVHCRMATTTERLHGSQVYREYLRPLGIEYTMVVVLPMREGVTRDVGLTRNAEGRPFDENDRALMNRLIPHVARAFTIGGALTSRPITTERSAELNRGDLRLLENSLGLSPVQAHLAALLYDGVSVRNAAEKLGITEGSARQYIRRIFVRTGTNRQIDLVRKIARTVSAGSSAGPG